MCVCVFYNVDVLYVCSGSVIWPPLDVCALTINVNGAGNIITPKYVFDKRVCMSRSGSKVAIVELCYYKMRIVNKLLITILFFRF